MPMTREESEVIIGEACSGAGSRLLSYNQLIEFRDLLNKMGLILQSIEAFELQGDIRRMRLDATGSIPPEEYLSDWKQNILQSNSYWAELLLPVVDKEHLFYKAWADECKVQDIGFPIQQS